MTSERIVFSADQNLNSSSGKIQVQAKIQVQQGNTETSYYSNKITLNL